MNDVYFSVVYRVKFKFHVPGFFCSLHFPEKSVFFLVRAAFYISSPFFTILLLCLVVPSLVRWWHHEHVVYYFPLCWSFYPRKMAPFILLGTCASQTPWTKKTWSYNKWWLQDSSILTASLELHDVYHSTERRSEKYVNSPYMLFYSFHLFAVVAHFICNPIQLMRIWPAVLCYSNTSNTSYHVGFFNNALFDKKKNEYRKVFFPVQGVLIFSL